MSGAASSIVLALLLATAYGAAFHFITGGPLRRLPIYILAAWLGFAVGHLLGAVIDLQLLQLGTLHLLSASLGSWAALFASRWLAGK